MSTRGEPLGMDNNKIRKMRLPAEAVSAGTARHAVEDMARGTGCLADNDVEDLCIAVGEAFANIVRHGSQVEAPFVMLCVECLDDRVAVHLEYDSEPFDLAPAVPGPDAMALGGYGLFLMRTLADTVALDFHAGQAHLRLEKQWKPDFPVPLPAEGVLTGHDFVALGGHRV